MKINSKLRGRYIIEQVRNGKVIATRVINNAITTVGLNHILDVVFGKAAPVTQVTPWYIGLINNDPEPTLLAADTLASHTGWVEFTDYTGNRKAWSDADSEDGVKESSSVATFPITDDGEIYGAFLASVATTTTGVLLSEGAFDEPLSLVNGDDLKIRITMTLTSG